MSKMKVYSSTAIIHLIDGSTIDVSDDGTKKYASGALNSYTKSEMISVPHGEYVAHINPNNVIYVDVKSNVEETDYVDNTCSNI